MQFKIEQNNDGRAKIILTNIILEKSSPFKVALFGE